MHFRFPGVCRSSWPCALQLSDGGRGKKRKEKVQVRFCTSGRALPEKDNQAFPGKYFPDKVPKELSDPMTSKFLRFFLVNAAVSVISASIISVSAISASAQTSGTGPSAAASAPVPVAAPIATGTGTKIGTINIEQAVVGTNEGQRDFEALRKKLEPKQNELKSQNDELESLQKQLQTQGDKLNEDARASLVKQIETKKKSFDRSVQDAQEDAQNQQKEIFQRILQKMAPVIVKHAQETGFAMIVDTSNPWPQSPILWYGEGGDITRAVVDLYNTQSGVPAPAAAGGTPAKPAAQKTTAPKPAAPKPTTPPQ
jgi:outer membrane protein